MKKEYDMSKAKRGPVISSRGKTRITLYLSNKVLQHFRRLGDKQGKGYQTLINEALLDMISNNHNSGSIATLRKIIREELKAIN